MSEDQSLYTQPPPDDGDYESYNSDRPNDFAGSEFIWVLRTARSRHRAGKSYQPDPSGYRNAIKAADYKLGELFQANLYAINNLEDFRGHFRDFWDAPLQQHRITKRIGYVVYRRSIKTRGPEGCFAEYPRKLLMLDLDGMPLPEDLSVTQNPEECVNWAVDHLLPPQFPQASFIYQLSSSAALTKRDNELNAHLWFITDQSYDNNELRAWARWWNAKQQLKILDPALYTAVQPHFINDPELLDGLVDPLAGRRLGLVYRANRTVHLYMPTEQEVAAELGLRQQRAISRFKQIKPKRERSSSNTDEDGLVAGEGQESEPESTSEPDFEDLVDDGITRNEVYVDAVRIGPGWQGYLNAIGFEGHMRAQLLAAVGSYFWEQGSRADRDVLRAAIETAIEESSFLDCSDPWSRPRADARGYLAAPSGGKSNVDEMISDIASRQSEKERLANDPWDSEWTLPTLTADEAFEQIEAAVHQVVIDAGMRRHRLLYGNDIWIAFQPPTRAAVNCSPGTGKTEAMVRAVAGLVTLDPSARRYRCPDTQAWGRARRQDKRRVWGVDCPGKVWNGSPRSGAA